ncbi:MAG: DMT family transporter [Sporolactobacillus sp.]
MKIKAWLLLVFCNLFWAGNMIVGKFVTTHFPTVWIIFFRWLIAFLLLWPLASLIEHPKWWKMIKENYLILLFLSIIGTVLYNWITYTALRYTSSLNASLINALNPGVILLFSAILLRQRMSIRQMVGLILSFIGVLMVITKGQLFSVLHTHYNRGDGLMLIVIGMWAVYSIAGRAAKNIPPITLIAITSLIGFMVTLPFLPFYPLDMQGLNLSAISGMIFLGIFPSFLSFVFWNIGTRRLGAGVAGLSMNFICVFTAIISALMGERLLFPQIAGGLIIIFGIVLSSGALVLHKRTPQNKKEEIS